MIVPNLASQPFLNTRPVWLVTGVAGLIILVFAGLNIQLYITSREAFATQYQRRQELQTSYDEVEQEVRGLLGQLDGLPWGSLQARVDRFNVILREHAFSWLELLDDIERVMPREVRLTSISPEVSDEGVKLSLMAIAESRVAMLELIDNFVNDPSFSEPLPKSEITPEGGSATGYTLTLSVTYHPPEVTP